MPAHRAASQGITFGPNAGKRMPVRETIGERLRAEALYLYPLQRPFFLVGLASAAVALLFQDWVVAVCFFTLFFLVGATWRMDMVPMLPACMAFMWLSPSVGYIFYYNTGVWPGVNTVGNVTLSVLLSMAGLASIVVGLRIALAIFRKTIFAKTLAPPSPYNMRRVFWTTIVVFAVGYTYDVFPMALWFGGAQIIGNLLALRFVFYFILLVTAFQRREGYNYVGWATAWVIGPQLLTGFSTFKEIIFVVLIAALFQWRPWIRTPQQARQNRRIFLFGFFGGVFLLFLGIVWTGGIKAQWRAEMWNREITTSPIERMVRFFEIGDNAVRTMDFGVAAEILASRFSSGSVYFSYVLDRVPQFMPHEDGALFKLAFDNATQPRFLFPDKPSLGGDSWLVQRYAGITVAGDESGTSIGLGFLAEFYIDFGIPGVIGLATLWGFVVGAAIGLYAQIAPSREFFAVFVIALCIQSLMGFDASFIKMLAGLIQRVFIAAAVFWLFGRYVQAWLLGAPRRTPRAAPPMQSGLDRFGGSPARPSGPRPASSTQPGMARGGCRDEQAAYTPAGLPGQHKSAG